jgi:tryptophan synthase alpha chain
MTARIERRFDALRAENRAALVTFIMGGDPDMAVTKDLLLALPKAGADIIEIGIPFSDPMADGPVIQAAGLRALKSGTKLRQLLQLVAEIRKEDSETPIVLMGYYNPVYRYGAERFCADAAKAGVDGFILVDLPPEEEHEFKPHAERSGLAFIRLIAPPSLNNRLPLLIPSSRGFLYYISVAGITGAKAAESGALHQQVAKIKAHTSLPVAVGFGIKTPQQAAEVAAIADAVVVGSALVDTLHREGKDAALALVKALAGAMRR